MPQIQPTPENIVPFLANAQPHYPTPDQIVGGATPTHKPEVIAMVRAWKKEHWFPTDRHGTPQQKFESIAGLLQQIALVYNQPLSAVLFDANIPSSCYQVPSRTIILNKPSIITALHELAHHLFGADETKACRWSVWLFKKTFPTAFSRLVWNGHCLVRPEESQAPQTAN